MAIPRQTFQILFCGSFHTIYNNYFLPLLTEDQARAEWCRLGGCDTPCENGCFCNIKAKEVKDERENEAVQNDANLTCLMEYASGGSESNGNRNKTTKTGGR